MARSAQKTALPTILHWQRQVGVNGTMGACIRETLGLDTEYPE